MALAISLVFDAETAARVEALWRSLAAAGISRDMLELNYPPHVTLIVTDDEALELPMRQALDNGDAVALAVKLGPVRRFAGTDITWLAVDGGPALHALHGALADAVPLEAIRPHYRPGQWVPHMTLQITGDALAGQGLLGAAWQDVREAKAIKLELARFLPVATLAGVALNDVS